MHFNHLKLDGGCGEGFSASSSDAQPPVLVLCSLFLLYLLIDDDNDTTLRKQSTSKFIYRNGKQIGHVNLGVSDGTIHAGVAPIILRDSEPSDPPSGLDPQWLVDLFGVPGVLC